MAEYRIYFIDQDDLFHGWETVECATDDDAFVCALERIGHFTSVEVWCDTRPVGRIGPNDY